MELTSKTTCGFSHGNRDSVPCKEGNLACNNMCGHHCEWSLANYNDQTRVMGSSLSPFRKDEEFKKLVYAWLDHVIDVHGHPDTREKKKKNGKYNGPFAFTMTMSPTDGLTEDQMIFACKKIMDQKSQPVKKFAWYLEYKDEETKKHPHIHGMYETMDGRRIESRHWMRSWKIWSEKPGDKLGAGFRGGYHRAVRVEEAYADYISKQNGVGDKFGV